MQAIFFLALIGILSRTFLGPLLKVAEEVLILKVEVRVKTPLTTFPLPASNLLRVDFRRRLLALAPAKTRQVGVVLFATLLMGECLVGEAELLEVLLRPLSAAEVRVVLTSLPPKGNIDLFLGRLFGDF